MTLPLGSSRLPQGGAIDRSNALTFSFDGQYYQGFRGDTLASALLANNVRLIGRSFKYHRPRGLIAAGSEEPNGIVELRSGARREPNTRATMIELYQGLDAQSQNRWPSLDFDLLSINSYLSPFLTAGFYYKTFMWPAALWEKLYEPMIRRAAGLGKASGLDDPDHYEKSTLFCDVLVIGSGPAGLMAARAAARSGARVVLAEEDSALGGRLLGDQRIIDGVSSAAWAATMSAELEAEPEVRILRRTAVFGVYDGGTYGALERVSDHLAEPHHHAPRQRLWRIVAKRAVLAAGAIERPLVFGNNDRPGIMLAGAVRTYLNRFGVASGSNAIVFVNNDDAASTVSELAAAGVSVSALVDPRPDPSPVVEALAKKTGIRVISGGSVERALGSKSVSGAEIRLQDGSLLNLPCDLIAMSGGWNPSVHLTTHLNGRPVWNSSIAAFVPGAVPPGMAVAGSASGALSLADAIATGESLGRDAAIAAGFKAKKSALPSVEPESTAIQPLWRVVNARGKSFVDFQNDVSVLDIELAEREGFRSVEHLKRYTTLGMATDQGKTANVNGLALMAEFTAKAIENVGTTVMRPPFSPVAIGAFGGHHREKNFKPTRLPPSHQWAVEQGAVFVEAGYWLRAQYYPKPGEKDWLETVTREVTAVRSSVGVCDVSTLGKIDIQGADASEFLERVYINGWKNLAIGRARYGLMLREDGIVMDDGTTTRLGEDHFFMTTTTANAAKVMQHLEFCHQWLWPDLDVQMISATEQWAQFSLAGPHVRDVLLKLVDPEHDISNAAFPYMAAGEITVCGGTRARLYRLSFSGELAFEIGVPSRYGDALIRKIMEAGAEYGITPYGTEALGVMRIEKGHVAGAELNGISTAGDLGLGRMMSTKKDYIGRVLAGRPALVDPNRPVVVGFRPVDRERRIRAGAHFIRQGVAANAQNDEGYMTSVAFSPSIGHWIGLGFLSRGPERMGEILRACDPIRGEEYLVEVVSPIFYDPEGEKLRG
jgi:sarcosine oxidase subunit alpha